MDSATAVFPCGIHFHVHTELSYFTGKRSSHKISRFQHLASILLLCCSTCLQFTICIIIIIMQRWFLSGEMECFAGGHVPLALLAIVTLLLCFLLVPVTLVVSLNLFKVRDVLVPCICMHAYACMQPHVCLTYSCPFDRNHSGWKTRVFL